MSEQHLTAQSVLGPDGCIARRLSTYEARDEQIALASSVEDAIGKGYHLVAEAGTGVGKSFAYLVPSILAARQRRTKDDKSKRIIVSTHTISLQEQLIRSDIPFLQAVLPLEFSAVLVKGRSNYLSLRRTSKTIERANQKMLFEMEAQKQLAAVYDWAQTTNDGSRADLNFRPRTDVWDEVGSDHGDCMGKKCPTYDDCFYYKARRRVWNADLLVVNHALFFSDLALRREGASLLPDYDTVIFDEAHTIESVAADHLGIRLSEGQIDYLMNRLYNDRSNKGTLIVHRMEDAQKQVMKIRHMSREFFHQAEEWARRFGRKNGRLDRPVEIENEVTRELYQLATMISRKAEQTSNESDQVELKAAVDRCHILGDSLSQWCGQNAESDVYWVEKTGARQQSISLMSAPVEVGPILQEQLFNEIPSVIMTSATLAIGTQDFSFFRSRIGVTNGKDNRQGSPFDYRKQARLILSKNMPDPTSANREFQQECLNRMKRHLLETRGRAFVLFTSYSMMTFCAERLMGWLAENDLTLYCQGKGLPRTAMVDRFRKDDRAVLFGTDSFWQGVDVPGDDLQNVIITKLPFSVPDQPLLEARVDAIRARGGNPFQEYQVPEAVIKLKQGFGRLIRSRSDTGRVVILDPRILTKPYGRLFLKSLPECQLEVDDGEKIQLMKS
ncbi:MAG: helicase C-terminal domain-containing protein [Fuerstiella sp.]